MPDRPWPTTVDELLRSAGAPAERIGPQRWLVGSMRVVRFDLGEEAAAGHRRFLETLGGLDGVGGPTVVGQDGPWLVTEVPAGLGADRPDQHPEPGNLAGLMGAGLAALHALPHTILAEVGDGVGASSGGASSGEVGDGVGDGWDPVVERCRRNVDAGLVDAAALPPPYDRYTPTRLLDLLVDGTTSVVGAVEDQPVVCHGSPTADRFLVDQDRFGGFDGLEDAVVADRHLDLAVTHISVAEVLGSEAVYAFYEGYGSDPDLARLDRGILARHLLIPAAGGR